MGAGFVAGCIVVDDLFVMQISLRDMMDCNDAMMGVANPFTLAAQVVYKEAEHMLHIDMLIDYTMVAHNGSKCTR